MRKSKSLKPISTTKPLNKSENDAQFELELCWCVQQLEACLNSGKLSEKIAKDTIKNLKILKGNGPSIRKRQLMRSVMGNYRDKMKEEEKTMSLASKKIQFTPIEEPNKKSCFVKKSAILTSGSDFKFNFNTAIVEENQSNGHEKEVEHNWNTNKLEFTPGISFKFNFNIDEENNEIDFDKLSIK